MRASQGNLHIGTFPALHTRASAAHSCLLLTFMLLRFYLIRYAHKCALRSLLHSSCLRLKFSSSAAAWHAWAAAAGCRADYTMIAHAPTHTLLTLHTGQGLARLLAHMFGTSSQTRSMIHGRPIIAALCHREQWQQRPPAPSANLLGRRLLVACELPHQMQAALQLSCPTTGGRLAAACT